MFRDIREVISRWDACLRYNVGKRGSHPTQSIHVSKPGDHYQIDLSVHLPESPDGYKAILHIIDVFTGFIVLRPLKDEYATTVAQELYKVFMLIGWPRVLQSDNGPQFVSAVLHSLTSMLGVMSRHISAFNPRADGKVERSIGVVMQSIKKMLHGSDAHWPLFLDFAQFVYNSKINRITGCSPFVLMFNRTPNEFKDYTVNPVDPPAIDIIDDWKEHQLKILSVIYPAICRRILSTIEYL
jgi:transposase InsO family protein